MTHLYVKICDLCGEACEAGSQNHAGHINTDIMVMTSNKVSTSIFREEFDICVSCLIKTGLYEILKKMQEMKKKNINKEKTIKELVKNSQKRLEAK